MLYCPECSTHYDDDSLRNCPNDGARLYKMDKAGKDPLLGSVVDNRFRIDSVIGEGGMGTVYRGQQLSVGRDVAIKVLRADLSHKQVALERFFREAKTISNLNHPNIVRLIDFGQDRDLDVLFLAMELVRGFNLADLIAGGRLRTRIALDVLYQACGALTEPHNSGVIHRDLKPDNILLVPMSDGTIQTKVLDFGIARALEQNTQITATGMICGTPAYMAPEQAQNEELDARADLYAMGVIFYEMLSGWPPFSGTSSLQIMLKHIQENPTPLRDLVPPGTVIPPVEDLVDQLMHKERDERPNTAREVRELIERVRREIEFDRIHVEAGMSLEEAREAWLLPKLPIKKGTKSGPTEVFRRETGMEHWLTNADDSGSMAATSDEMAPTLPDPHNERVVIGVTKKGAQQAWTPGDQAAVQRIKDTNDVPDAVDVFSKTEGLPPLAESKERKTMVEEGLSADSSPRPISTEETRPVTKDDLHAPSDRSGRIQVKTETGQRAAEKDPTIETRRPTKDTPLLVAAIALGLVAVAAGIAVLYLFVNAGGQKVETANVEPTPVIKAAPVEKDTPPALPTTIIMELAQQKVAFGAAEASREMIANHASAAKTTPEKKTRPRTKPKKETPNPKKADPPKKTTPSKENVPSMDDIFKKGALRSE